MLSEASGSPLPTNLPTISESLRNSASTWPDKLALACLHQSPNLYSIAQQLKDARYLRWTYAELDLAVDRFVRQLSRLNVGRGQNIATFLPNCVEYVIVFCAAHRLGCTFVPINPRTLLNSKETSHMLHVAKVSVVVVQDRSSASSIDQLDIPFQAKISISDAGQAWILFEELMLPSNVTRAAKPLDSSVQSDIVTILFTSGTTSLPKGCPHTDLTLNAFMANLALGGSSEKDIFCSVLPNNHAMGYFYCLYHFCHGGAVVYPGPGFNSRLMLEALEAENCTHTCLVPTTLHGLLDAFGSSAAPPNLSLKDLCLAGSSVSPENMQQVIRVLNSEGVSTGFGMTEGSPVWTGYKTNPQDLIRGAAVVSGTASPGATIRICAPSTREPLPRGQEGEIHQTGPGLVNGYIDTQSDMFYTDENGRRWFVTGDQAVMHADGAVSITGRYKDMIIRGGENIAPAAIEAILNTFEDVQASHATF